LAPDARIYLCGRVTVERNGRALTEAAIGGRQGRLLFTYLGTRRTQPVSRPQLIGAIWESRTPPSVETAINAIVSKLQIKPYPTLEALSATYEIACQEYGAKDLNPLALWDMHWVKELDDEGFIDALIQDMT